MLLISIFVFATYIEKSLQLLFVSDLVGNPEDSFSHDVAQKLEIYEPRCEKTGLPGFRPGPTQIGLYIHKRWIEA